jgi:tripartite-type tricarboxylate transporter receptor subunit TctC
MSAIRKRIKALLLAAATAVAGVAGLAHAAYPEQTIRLIVPFAAGGPSDVLARAIGQKISGPLGKPVIIDNKPGAGTNLAASFVAKSPADGYTLFLMMVGTQAINEAMYPKLSYDTLRDFAPVSLVASSSLMLVAHPSLGVKSLKELIAMAKARPGKLDFGSSGAGTPLHLGGELLNKAAGINIVHVPYKGAAPALADVLGGQIPLAMVGTPSVLAYTKAGRLVPLGVTSAQRTSLAPDVPTVAETLPGYEVELVYAIVAPASTPKDIVTRLNAEIRTALQERDLRGTLLEQGFEVRTSTPEELAAYTRDEIRKWAPIVKETGVKAE